MKTQRSAVAALAAVLLSSSILLSGCTGGTESSAAEQQMPKKNGVEAPQNEPSNVDANKAIETINPAIPIYAGARFRDDLTRRDAVMIRNQYGPNA